MIIPRDKKIRVHSTNLRNHATQQENHLWYEFLRTYPVRFNRQRIIGEYIADFYCAKARLVIEIDGNQHFEANALEYDAIRTEFLSSLEIKVLRFTNREIEDTFSKVCMAIDREVKTRIPKTSFGKGGGSPQG